ncbi:hypothetical protein C2E21_7295 [Chlorella sorokiniana]|uniref:Uncharacterized protein n=1 Tax=Chlorella sorokiniana TaxID=3076 RepID=A0A2P6THN7_CHLSO|nr:hypothetical protein C2E21_7295 [Chlorella sorokiniana]|eukprot:PRW33803.1 hypothetical protein C2E21_7295 [Chlorella sorokiniana]
MTRREVVAVANTDTLEAAVRGCMEDGATKVMVVPYCTSLEFQPETNPAMALAEVQSRLPGIRCMMGETISVSTMLAEVIESQVKVVDGRRPDVAERWFTPEPRAVNRQSWEDFQRAQRAQQAQQAQQHSAAGPQHAQQAEPAQAHAAPSHSAEGGVNGSSSARKAWSDDFSSVMVVDYRPKPGAQAAEPASASASSAAVNGNVNGTPVNGTPVNVNGSSEATGLNGRAAAPLNGATHTSSSSSGGSDGASAPGSRCFAEWAGVSGALDSSSSSTAQDVPFADFADWAGDGQPEYEQVLDKRLTGIEDQLSRIAGLLEMMPKSQLAQQEQQAKQAQQLAALHLEQVEQEDSKASNAVPLRLAPPKPKKPFILRLWGQD